MNQTKWDGERHATCDSASSSSPRHIERRSVVIVCTAVVFAFRKCCTSSAIRKLLWPSTMLPLFVVYKSDSVRVHHDSSKSRWFCMPVSPRSANDSMTTACSGCTCTDSSRLLLVCCGISATRNRCDAWTECSSQGLITEVVAETMTLGLPVLGVVMLTRRDDPCVGGMALCRCSGRV